MNEEILSIILSNIRLADERMGDIKAQIAALTVGERRFTALLDRYGADTVNECIAELKARAERQMRAKIATIPDGEYHGAAYIDSDGVVDAPLKIDMKIRKKDTDLYFDMSESSPPYLGPMNSVIATTKSAIYPGDQTYLPGNPDQCRHLRAAAYRGPGGNLPLRQVSAAGVGLCSRGESTHCRSRLRDVDARPP